MSKLEQNTTALDEVLAMVNALPDAGSGGGGGASEATKGTFDYDYEMSAPGAYNYTLRSDELLSSTRNFILIRTIYTHLDELLNSSDYDSSYVLLWRVSKSAAFAVEPCGIAPCFSSPYGVSVEENKITLHEITQSISYRYLNIEFIAI